ncbi:NAD/FAD-utilizing enzyme [Alteromonas sp. ASW11-130]|uniref:NAD/FAD-utilizing enzyme n=1 Tax=Alteromonas sp. ASW11-130 TaxID=3015775 RepID=UPI002242A013|nr:NAD/FAD-utilizing enzyme [Alteromonas sp. ASW11-130]MCW8090913.1 NAD/FAD-utilizing enzyme [Alteromonas sp. ASW11-130]
MSRHYYISDDLDDLEVVERELEQQGVARSQIHVLSENDTEVEQHHLHAITPFFKKDVIHSSELGAFVGVAVAAVLLAVVYLLELHNSAVGWLPFIFGALVILGFCVWEGGLIGVQVPNHQFKRFQTLLKKGRHVFFVDTKDEQEANLARVVAKHPHLREVSTDQVSLT